MNAIEIVNLQKRYAQFKISNLNLTLPEGGVMGLIGENGAGKSTLIKLMMNLIRRDGGEIRVLGKGQEEHFEVTKQDIGVVFDETGLPPSLKLPQLEKVMRLTYKNWDTTLFYQLADRFQLSSTQRFGTFSKGMKMKTGIAMAMAHRPRLLIMDEPTSGLDPASRDDVVRLLFEYTRSEERSVLISSHIVSDLEKLCDYITFMHQGNILLSEDKETIYESYGLIHCDRQQADSIPQECVISREDTSYSTEMIVRRVPEAAALQPEAVGLEKLFVALVKGGRNESVISF